MTGVAQKGGAVTTYVRIAARPQDLHTIRIAAGEANAVIGSDLLVTAENAILTRMQRGVTRAVINTNRMATVAFIKNPDLQSRRGSRWRRALREAIGADATRISSMRRASRPRCSAIRWRPTSSCWATPTSWGSCPCRARRSSARSSSTAPRSRPTGARSSGAGSPATIRRRVEQQARPAETDVGSDRVDRAGPRRRDRAPRRLPDRLPGRGARAALPRARRPRARRGGARGRRRRHAARPRRSPATTSSCWRSRTSTRSRACTRTASSSGRSPRRSRATTRCATTSRRRCG